MKLLGKISTRHDLVRNFYLDQNHQNLNLKANGSLISLRELTKEVFKTTLINGKKLLEKCESLEKKFTKNKKEKQIILTILNNL